MNTKSGMKPKNARRNKNKKASKVRQGTLRYAKVGRGRAGMPKVWQGRPKVGQGRRKVGKDSVHEVQLPGGARMLLGVSFHYVGRTLREPPACSPLVVGSGRTLATLPPWDPVAGCYTLDPPALVSAPPELPRVPKLSALEKVAAVAVGLCLGVALAAWLI